MKYKLHRIFKLENNMPIMVVFLAVLFLGLVGFFIALARARVVDKNGKMHSRPHYYAWWTCLLTIVPACLFLLLWNFGSFFYIGLQASADIPSVNAAGEQIDKSIALNTLYTLANHASEMSDEQIYGSYSDVREYFSKKGVFLALNAYDGIVKDAYLISYPISVLKTVGEFLTALIAFVCFALSLFQIKPRIRARNKVETMIKCGLVIASIIAIFVTICIVLSMLFQTINFFQSVSLSNFFLGTVWNPGFAAAGATNEVGQFGLLPLLAGTLYIALVAMIFAVPVGLFAAIYMAEYASSRVRSIVKPLLEVLAGIPTIVYGFFGLMTVGPFLRDLSISLAGGQGFIMAQSVLTAGLVMGIMLIPFVSSLSDDIITAVPGSLRDGSYGLGATQSETIKRVILPAALPGIVGALLLTASRAIGETMIVVLAAGVAANLSLNPLQAMTTITVKIVNQLTGDLEFNSPQTLVAFALAMTLFVLTLLMNVFALYIVRKYREQYE